jgi:hypothetical protein
MEKKNQKNAASAAATAMATFQIVARGMASPSFAICRY